MRKRYVRVNGEQLTADLDVPWGGPALMTLITLDDGRYAVETEKGLFLSFSGELKPAIDESCKFSIEFSKADMSKIHFKGSNNSTSTWVHYCS